MSTPTYAFASYGKAEREAEELAHGDGPWPVWCVVEDFDYGEFIVMPAEAADTYVDTWNAEIQYTARLAPEE